MMTTRTVPMIKLRVNPTDRPTINPSAFAAIKANKKIVTKILNSPLKKTNLQKPTYMLSQ